MRMLRFALLGLAGLVGLLVLAAVLVVLLFDPNAHKAQLQQLVLKQTGRELQLPGDLKLKLFPWLALDVGAASLGNATGFGTAPMVEIKHARLGLKLLPLLHRQVEIGAILLEDPTIRLEVDAAGHNNWSDLGAKSNAPEPTDRGGPLPAMSIEQLQIVDGDLHYVNHQDKAGSTSEINALNLKTGRLEPGKPFDLQLGVVVKQGQGLEMAIKLQTTATVDLENSRYQLQAPALDVQLKAASLPRTGLPVQLQFTSIVADLKAQTVTLPGMQLRAAGATLTGDLTGSHIVDAPQFAGNVKLLDGSPREWLHNLGIELPVTRDSAMFKHLELSGNLTASTDALMLSALRLKLDDSLMTGRAGLRSISHSALEFDLNIDRLNADRYLPPAAPATKTTSTANAANAANATSKATAPVQVPVELLRSLNAHGSLRMGTAVFAGIQYTNLHIGVNAEEGKLHVFPSEAQMYGGQYRGDITVDASGRVPRLSVDEHVTGIDFAALLQDMLQTKRMSGRGNAAVKAVASGMDTAALLRTLTGTLEFHVDNGALEGADLWYEIRRARALLKQQAPPPRTGPEHTAFTALSATGKLTNGVLANDDLNVAMQYLQVTGRGTADLPASTIDYRLEASALKIPTDSAGSGGTSANSDAQDLVGFKIPVTVTGTFAAPKVRPDVEGLVKARVQQEIDKRKDALKQQLQDKLQDKLKGLLGH